MVNNSTEKYLDLLLPGDILIKTLKDLVWEAYLNIKKI